MSIMSSFYRSAVLFTKTRMMAKRRAITSRCIACPERLEERHALAAAWPVVQAGGQGWDSATGIAPLDDGTSIVVGKFSDAATFGTTTLTSRGNWDVYVAKLNADGTFAWVQQIGSAGYDDAFSVCVCGDGTVALAGCFSGNVLVGREALASSGSSDGFVAKLNTQGNFIWARSFGGSADDRATGVSSLADGAVICTGTFQGNARGFGSVRRTSQGLTDTFVTKLSKTGNALWAVTAGGAGSCVCSSVSAFAEGGVCIAGTFSGVVSFGRTTLTSSLYRQDAFVAQLRPNGEIRWAASVGGRGADAAIDVRALANGYCVVVGQIVGGVVTRDSDGSPCARVGSSSDGFIALLTGAGRFEWFVRSNGGTSSFSGVTIQNDGFLMAGTYTGSASLGGITLASASKGNAFLARVDTNGVVGCAFTPGQGNSWAERLSSRADGAAFLAGAFSESLAVGSKTLVSRGKKDALILKIDASVFAGPTKLSGAASNGSVRLSWLAPASVGYSPIKDYVIQYKASTALLADWTTFVDGVSSATSTTVTGLPQGRAYVFRVAAANAGGRSVFTPSTGPIRLSPVAFAPVNAVPVPAMVRRS